MTIIFANIHIYLINKPTNKLVTVMVVLIVKFSFAGSYTSDKSLVVNDAAVAL